MSRAEPAAAPDGLVAWLVKDRDWQMGDEHSICEIVFASSESAARRAANHGGSHCADEVDDRLVATRTPQFDSFASRGAPTALALLEDGWVLVCPECAREVRADALDYRDQVAEGEEPESVLPEEAVLTEDDTAWCSERCRSTWDLRASWRRALEAHARAALPPSVVDVYAWEDSQDGDWRIAWRDPRADSGARIVVGGPAELCGTKRDLELYAPQIEGLRSASPPAT